MVSKNPPTIGDLVTSKDHYIYLWDSYDEKENSMEGSNYFFDKMTGVVLDVTPTKNTCHYGWVTKILTSDENGKIVMAWIWGDMLKILNSLYIYCEVENEKI